MTIAELIETLNDIEDKSLTVCVLTFDDEPRPAAAIAIERIPVLRRVGLVIE